MFTRINNFKENVTEMKKITVNNLTSPRSGDAVKNQFCINTIYSNDRSVYNCVSTFQSYSTTCIKFYHDCKTIVIYPEAFNYSVTTTKYSKQFLKNNCYFSVNDIEKITKLAKSEDYGNDCPLILTF